MGHILVVRPNTEPVELFSLVHRAEKKIAKLKISLISTCMRAVTLIIDRILKQLSGASKYAVRYSGLAIAGGLLFVASRYATDDDLTHVETFCILNSKL